MTTYVFERNIDKLRTRNGVYEVMESVQFLSDEVAIVHAQIIGADYVWSFKHNANPHTVWCRTSK